MTQWHDDDLLTAGLAALATDGPPGLLERIAARWSRVPGPTCDLYVASTHLGVIYVRTSDAVHDDAAEFATLFHRRFTSPLVAAPQPPAELLPPPTITRVPGTEPASRRPPSTQPPLPQRPGAQSPAPQPPVPRPASIQPPAQRPVSTQPPIPQPAVPGAADLSPTSGAAMARLRFDLSRLSAFEREVLLAVLTIPRGQVRPHSWVAHEIGRPTAAPAIDITLSRNPVPVLIPCHRVINADGTLGNHVFGPTVKRALLDAEGTNVGEVYQLAQLDIHYVASDIAGVVCFPTCPDARRTDHAHRHGFATIPKAEEAGYRPCPTCRPVSNEVS
jgi:O-6-methylguanine DNA methyltransferase